MCHSLFSLPFFKRSLFQVITFLNLLPPSLEGESYSAPVFQFIPTTCFKKCQKYLGDSKSQRFMPWIAGASSGQSSWPWRVFWDFCGEMEALLDVFGLWSWDGPVRVQLLPPLSCQELEEITLWSSRIFRREIGNWDMVGGKSIFVITWWHWLRV